MSQPPLPSNESKPQLWYYSQNRQPVGPMPLAEIGALIKTGQLSPNTLVWREGEKDWKPISSIFPEDLWQSAEIPPRPSSLPPPLPAPTHATAKRRWMDMKRVMLPLLVLNTPLLFLPVSLILLWTGKAFDRRGKVLATGATVLGFGLMMALGSYLESQSREEFALQKTDLLSAARSELEKGNAAPALRLKSRFSGSVKDADLQVLIAEAEAMQSAKNTESKRQQESRKVDAGTSANESAVASTSELRRLGKREIDVLLPEVESLAHELEGFLADIQGGSPVTLETVGKIKTWKNSVQFERKQLRTIDPPMFTASNNLFLAVDQMNLAWENFEKAMNEQNPSEKADLALRHASNLKLMRQNIESAKGFAMEGKY